MMNRRRRAGTKKGAQRVHVRRRALERLGFPIGDRTIDEMVRRIQCGEATFVRRSSNRVTIWEMEIPGDDRRVRCAYDKRTKGIATVIPVEDASDGAPAADDLEAAGSPG